MVHAFSVLVDGGVRIAVAGNCVIVSLLVQVVVAVAGRVVAVIFESSVASVGHRVVVVGPVRQGSSSSCVIVSVDSSASVLGQFQLPQRVLRVDRAAVVRVRVAVLRVGHVDPIAAVGVSVSHAHSIAVAVLSGVERVLAGRVVQHAAVARVHQTGVASLVLQAGVVRRRRLLLLLGGDGRTGRVGLFHFQQLLELLGATATVAVKDGKEDKDEGADDAGNDDGHHVLGGQVRQGFGRFLNQIASDGHDRLAAQGRVHLQAEFDPHVIHVVLHLVQHLATDGRTDRDLLRQSPVAVDAALDYGHQRKLRVHVERDRLRLAIKGHVFRFRNPRQVDDGRGRQGVAQRTLSLRVLSSHLDRVRLELLQVAEDARIGVLAVVFVRDRIGAGSGQVEQRVDRVFGASVESFVPFQRQRVVAGLDGSQVGGFLRSAGRLETDGGGVFAFGVPHLARVISVIGFLDVVDAQNALVDVVAVARDRRHVHFVFAVAAADDGHVAQGPLEIGSRVSLDLAQQQDARRANIGSHFGPVVQQDWGICKLKE